MPNSMVTDSLEEGRNGEVSLEGQSARIHGCAMQSFTGTTGSGSASFVRVHHHIRVDVALLDSGTEARGTRIKFRRGARVGPSCSAGISPVRQERRDKAKGLTIRGRQGKPSRRARRRVRSRRAIHPFYPEALSIRKRDRHGILIVLRSLL